ncbi:MAG: hypothetical protein AAB340_01845 [Patescibacteria group bacterium]
MRKRFKIKKHSCALCKPHKLGWDNRWKNKELAHPKEFEKLKSQLV